MGVGGVISAPHGPRGEQKGLCAHPSWEWSSHPGEAGGPGRLSSLLPISRPRRGQGQRGIVQAGSSVSCSFGAGSCGQLAGEAGSQSWEETPLGRTLSFIKRMTGKTKVGRGGAEGSDGTIPCDVTMGLGWDGGGSSFDALPFGEAMPQFPLSCLAPSIISFHTLGSKEGEKNPKNLGEGDRGRRHLPSRYRILPRHW